jgi:thiazole synthase ThiGH ThiG subunit
MELGAGVLVNTAITVAGNQTDGWSLITGRKAYEAQLAKVNRAVASSPLTAFLYSNPLNPLKRELNSNNKMTPSKSLT